MKIQVNKNEDGSHGYPVITINLYDVWEPEVIRNALKLALTQDGYSKETINQIFNESNGSPTSEAE